MGKRAFDKYLAELPEEELRVQLSELYQKFPIVKEYYDFSFHPKEDKRLQEAKAKISNEYFPLKRRRPRARRSTAQKLIKHFRTLGMDPTLIADLMFYNLETMQRFSRRRNTADSFFKSMANSYGEAVHFVTRHGIVPGFRTRILAIYDTSQQGSNPYAMEFSSTLDLVDIDSYGNSDH